MKTLLLMRHAKSSWKDPSIPDHDRPLAKRGLRDAQRMGELLGERELSPQRIISSSATRSAETARIIHDNCKCATAITLSDKLYLAEADAYFAELVNLPNDIERVMLIGHNPGLESLLQMLSGQIESLPTAVIATISLPVKNWGEIGPGIEGTLVELWRPKDLPEGKKTEPKKEEKPAKKAKTTEKPKEKAPKKAKVTKVVEPVPPAKDVENKKKEKKKTGKKKTGTQK